MVYKQNFVVSIRVANSKQILRENDGVVRLPFGSEYSIYMKNTNSQRAVVSIFIDGKSIGDDLVINAHESLELERFVKGDMSKGRRFRFIEKTDKISEHRGDHIEDGLVEVRYKFENPVPTIKITSDIVHHHHHYTDPYAPNPYYKSGTVRQPWETDISFCSMSSSYDTSIRKRGIPQNEEGITVEGSDSDQKFQSVSVGRLETQEHVITIKLLGIDPVAKVKIVKPITVRMTCPTCGTRTKGKFCEECGTRIRD